MRESNASRRGRDGRPAAIVFDNDGLLLDSEPSPDLYVRACELLGVPPAEVVALEDSPPGVAAAHAAGLLVVGVPSVDGVELAADVAATSLGDPCVRAALGLDEAGEPSA